MSHANFCLKTTSDRSNVCRTHDVKVFADLGEVEHGHKDSKIIANVRPLRGRFICGIN